MRVVEFTGSNNNATKVAALAEFFRGRIQDTNAKNQIDLETFIHLANQQGASVNKRSLIDMSQRELGEMFNVEGDKIVFKGAGRSDPEEMPVDKAEQIVKKAAKRAMKK